MAGGKRKNAGRKPISVNEKKAGYTIYLSPQIHGEIERFGNGSSFSESCYNLIVDQIEYYKNKESRTIKVMDLFAGLGGIRIGFEQAFESLGYNVECIFTSEIKDYAIKVYKNYFGDNDIHGDITKVSSNEIPDFDYLLAGFPCQPFSTAGLGLGFEDTRGTLFFEIERILRDKEPKGFLLENVEGLINHDNGKTLDIMLKSLKRLGYEVTYKMLDSKDFGVAQSRRRVYIIGMKNDKINLDNFRITKAKLGDILESGLSVVNSNFTKSLFRHYNVEEVIGKSIKDKRGGKNNIHSWDIELKGRTSKNQRKLLNLLLKERRKKSWAKKIGIEWMDGMPLTINQIKTFFDCPNIQDELDDLVEKGYLRLEHPKKIEKQKRVSDKTKEKGYNIVAGKLSFEFTKILDPEELAPTLVATDVSRLGVIDGNGVRRLTIREAQRLCGHPEDYDLSIINEQEAFDLLGNTVCVPVIKEIAYRMAQSHSMNSISEENAHQIV